MRFKFFIISQSALIVNKSSEHTHNSVKYNILLDVLLRSLAEYFFRVVPYFGEPVGRVKIQTTTLLSNTPNWYVRASEFRGYLFTGNA